MTVEPLASVKTYLCPEGDHRVAGPAAAPAGGDGAGHGDEERAVAVVAVDLDIPGDRLDARGGEADGET